MLFRAVFHLIGLSTMLFQCVGKLVIAPRHTESKVGDAAYFNCSTDLTYEEIFWFHGEKYIYTGKGIIAPYNGRFVIDRSTSIGSHNLVIHSVEPGDAGEYTCIDAEGGGTRRSAELVVLDNDPDCHSNIHKDGVIGQNIFNIPPDEVQLTCAVTYHGNILPQMEWRKVGDNSSIKASVTSNITSNNRLIYILNFNGDIAIDKSSYVCQTKRSTESQYKCTSEIIKVLYFVERNTTELSVVRGAKVTCVVSNSTFPCTSQWYHDNYTCPLSCDETLTTHLLGEYQCTVKCQVREKVYYFEALKAFVVEPTTDPSLSAPGTVVAAVVLPVVIIVAVASIAVLIVCNRQLKIEYARRKNDDEYLLDYLKEKSLFKTDDSSEANENQVISSNYQFLVENMKSSRLINIMHETNCITMDERDQLMNQQTDDSINDAILRWMRTIPFREDKGRMVLECLRQTQQNFVADLLVKGGVVIKCMISTKMVKANLFTKSSKKSAEKLKQTEAMVIERLNRTQGLPLSSFPGATSSIPLDAVVIAPYCQQVAHGIVIWFWCQTNIDKRHLRKMYESDNLLEILSTILKEFSNDSASPASKLLVPTSINIILDEFVDKVFEEEVDLLHKLKNEANGENVDIQGVAILNEMLFVVNQHSSELKTYNCSTICDDFRILRMLEVKELVSARDICSCKINNCLYIMDEKTDGIPKEVLKISTDGNVVGKWLTDDNAEGTLSATTEGNVLITVCRRQMLLEYSHYGELERAVRLPGCEVPNHAIKRDDRYIVCHSYFLDTSSHRVCLVDKEGNVEKSFGYGHGSAENQLNVPNYLAAGSSGCVIVADLFNDRVLLLDSNLKFKTKIVAKNKQMFGLPKVVSLGETLLVVLITYGIPYETISDKAGESRKEIKGDTSTKNNDLLIEEDSRILVFDIRPLLEKYDG